MDIMYCNVGSMAGGGNGIDPGAGTKGVAWCLRAAWFLSASPVMSAFTVICSTLMTPMSSSPPSLCSIVLSVSSEFKVLSLSLSLVDRDLLPFGVLNMTSDSVSSLTGLLLLSFRVAVALVGLDMVNTVL
jgi:hypothetical protein